MQKGSQQKFSGSVHGLRLCRLPHLRLKEVDQQILHRAVKFRWATIWWSVRLIFNIRKKEAEKMGVVILKAEQLNLPEAIAKKLKGRKVKVTDEGERIIIAPVDNPILKTRGMLKGGNFSTEKLMEQKRLDEELES